MFDEAKSLKAFFDLLDRISGQETNEKLVLYLKDGKRVLVDMDIRTEKPLALIKGGD